MNLVSVVNTRSQFPSAAQDFDAESSRLSRARNGAHNGAHNGARDNVAVEGLLEEEREQSQVNAQFESSVARENRENDADAAALALQQSASNGLSLSMEFAEQSEIDELESDEIASANPDYQNTALGERNDNRYENRDEDYAEFERVFVEWKATGDPRLRERLILMNRSMVIFLARRFMDRGELFEDVLQVGMLGLIYALDGYNLERGVKFSTFAIPTISGEIRRYFRDKVSGMRVPRGLQELHSQLQTRIEELTQQLDRSPTYAEIAFSLKIEVEQVVEAMELGSAIDPLSIDDRFYGEESATIAESIGAPDPQLHAYEEHAALQAALEKLPAQERRVLEMNFFEGHSQAEIARRLNVSQMHISRLLRRSLAQLKELLEDA